MYLLLFPLILFPAFGDAIPDYDTPYSPILTDKAAYSWTEKIKIKIIAPSWNTDQYLIDSIGDTDDHLIKISSGESTLKPYRFIETDADSGIFAAEVTLTGFPHDADGDGDVDTTPRTDGTGPTDGFLKVDSDSAVTISFEFADGVVLVESVPIIWNLGEIQFSKEIILLDDSVTISVTDSDMNLNPEALDQILIQIFSESDVAGINVNAVETSQSSGTFTATVSLSQTLPSSGNRLHSVPGDVISAKYDDHTLPKPYSTSDHLEVKTLGIVDSPIHTIQRLENSQIILSDSYGNKLQSSIPNKQIQMVGTITNDQNFKQKFVYFFQVKDAMNHVESISWIQSELYAGQSLDVSQSWIPKKSGTYQIETFVWNSISDSVGLAPVLSTAFTIE